MNTKASFTGSFQPRDGQTLKVVRVAQVTAEPQASDALNGQLATIENYIKGQYGGEVEFIDIAMRGGDAQLEREKYQELFRIIKCQSADVVIAEDQSRFGRFRNKFHQLLNLCFGCGVRLIGISDQFDTATVYSRISTNGLVANVAEAS